MPELAAVVEEESIYEHSEMFRSCAVTPMSDSSRNPLLNSKNQLYVSHKKQSISSAQKKLVFKFKDEPSAYSESESSSCDDDGELGWGLVQAENNEDLDF